MSIVTLQKAIANLQIMYDGEVNWDIISKRIGETILITNYIERETLKSFQVISLHGELFLVPSDMYKKAVEEYVEPTLLQKIVKFFKNIFCKKPRPIHIDTVSLGDTKSFTIVGKGNIQNVFEGVKKHGHRVHVFKPEQLEILDPAYDGGVYFSITNASSYTFFYYTDNASNLEGFV